MIVAGEPVTHRCAGTAAGLGGDDLAAAAGVLRTLRLIRAAGSRAEDTVEPFHDRVRDVAAARLAPEARRAHHRALALAYERWDEGSAELLARHWQGAGERDRAAGHARRAAGEAYAALDFDRAADLYRIALELGAHEPDAERELRTAFGEALGNAGRPRDSAQQFVLAARGADPGVRLELRRRSALALLTGGYLEEGLESIRGVLAEIGLGLARSPLRALLSLLFRRAWVRLRGLGWKPRAPSELPQRELTRIDICWSVAAALGVADHIRGADFQARHLLLALRAGHAPRVLRALFAEICFLAAGGARRRASALARLGEEQARALGDPYGLALASWGQGFVDYFCDTSWKSALERFSGSEALLRGHYQTGLWELDTVQLYCFFARMYLGQLAELGRLVADSVREAERRGDRYMAVNLRSRLCLPWLVRDDPEGARADVEAALASWAPASEGFQVQHFWVLHSRCEIALYAGDAAGAAARMEAEAPLLRRSLLLRLPLVRVEITQLCARIALAVGAAAGEPERRRRAREAAALGRRLAREELPLGRAWAPLVLAGAALLEGDRARAVAGLEAAVAALDANDTVLYAHAARRRLGELVGGERGAALAREADGFLAGQGVRDPARLCAVLVPC